MTKARVRPHDPERVTIDAQSCTKTLLVTAFSSSSSRPASPGGPPNCVSNPSGEKNGKSLALGCLRIQFCQTLFFPIHAQQTSYTRKKPGCHHLVSPGQRYIIGDQEQTDIPYPVLINDHSLYCHLHISFRH